MLTAGPAAITTIRFHTGWRKYARWRDLGRDLLVRVHAR